jgi:serine phosphatase RsbU (regulator of sigma subunit)
MEVLLNLTDRPVRSPRAALGAMDAFADRLLSIVDKRRMAAALMECLRQNLDPGAVGLAWPAGTDGLWSLLIDGAAPRSFRPEPADRLVRELYRTDRAFPLRPGPDRECPGGLGRELREVGEGIVFPVKQEGRLVGLVALGEKPGGGAYSADEVELTTLLADQFAAALATADRCSESIEKLRIEQEVRAARRIRADLVPGSLDIRAGIDVAAFTSPSQTAGGDFYDYFAVDRSRVGLVIADAHVDGAPAATLIPGMQAILKQDAARGSTIERTLDRIHRHLATEAARGFFTTIFYGILDAATGVVEYANAGHESPILVRRNGGTEFLPGTGPALGAVTRPGHDTSSVEMHEGDCLLLYTDGVTGGVSPAGRHYGLARLKDLAIVCRHKSSDEVLASIKCDIERFNAPGPPDDDMTTVVVRIDRLEGSACHAA